MATSANHPVNNNLHRHHHLDREGARGDILCVGNSCPPMDRTCSALKHDPGLSIYWSSEEQNILEEGLSQYASDSGVSQYAKIAMQLDNKTVRDVALRCRWMTKKENGKRRKEDHSVTKKSKDKKKIANPLSAYLGSPSEDGTSPQDTSLLPLEYDAVAYRAIGGLTGELLQRNAQVFSHICANLSSHRLEDNISLFCLTRNNIHIVLNRLKEKSDVMRQMPSLPVKMNEDLASTILPPSILMRAAGSPSCCIM